MTPPKPHNPAPANAATHFILALGSNLGDRRAHLKEGVEFLSRHVAIEKVSRVFECPPWGPLASQPDYLNLVLRGSTEGVDPLRLLDLAQEAERAAGRARTIPQGPRTLDVDLVFYGDLRVRSSRLEVPHPSWANRPFVSLLVPEVAGDMTDPESGCFLRGLRTEEDGLPAGYRVVEPLQWGSVKVEVAR